MVIADPIVRNMSTVGGNLARGDAANDHPTTMLALGTEVATTGPGGEHRIPLDEFFQGPLTTALSYDEILIEARIPMPPPSSGGAYLKMERKVGDFATAGVAVFVIVRDGVCERAGIGLTNVGPTPIKATNAEAFLQGKRLDEETVIEAARLAAKQSQPAGDLRGPEEFKRDMVRVLTIRALHPAVERAGEGLS